MVLQDNLVKEEKWADQVNQVHKVALEFLVAQATQGGMESEDLMVFLG